MEFGQDIEEAIKEHFNKAREAFMISRYEPGIIKKLYQTQFSDMSLQLVETVKNKCIGHTGRANLQQLIKSSSSINELLHVMHAYIINNEKILQSMPVVSTREMGYYPITLYGEENEISKKIFEEFPTELGCGWTEVVSMKNKILMMIRDKGHALTIDMDISETEEIFIKYFVPKLCNEDMIRVLPGVNPTSITKNGATGEFVASKEEIIQKLFNFIEKVPTDYDIPELPIDWSSVINKKKDSPEIDEEIEAVFEEEQVKELAKESNIIVNIDKDKKLKNQNISEETKDLLSLIYYDYIATEEEKEEITKIWNENESLCQENLFKKKNEDHYEQDVSNLPIVIQKETLIQKIINILKKIKTGTSS